MSAVKFVLPALLVLTACATVSVGREFDLQGFRDKARQGVTTQAEVRAWLGAPAGTGVSVEPSGERYAQWTYYHGTGRMPGMRDARFSILQMKFDPQGRLRAWNWSGEDR